MPARPLQRMRLLHLEGLWCPDLKGRALANEHRLVGDSGMGRQLLGKLDPALGVEGQLLRVGQHRCRQIVLLVREKIEPIFAKTPRAEKKPLTIAQLMTSRMAHQPPLQSERRMPVAASSLGSNSTPKNRTRKEIATPPQNHLRLRRKATPSCSFSSVSSSALFIARTFA